MREQKDHRAILEIQFTRFISEPALFGFVLESLFIEFIDVSDLS